jgi:hypothetical protein
MTDRARPADGLLVEIQRLGVSASVETPAQGWTVLRRHGKEWLPFGVNYMSLRLGGRLRLRRRMSGTNLRQLRRIMRHKLFAASCIAAIAALGASAPAYADPNPHGNSCQAVEAGMPPYSSAGNTPGNAATSPGSVFNEPGVNSPDGGKGGLAYNKAQADNKVGATAQYDTACANTLKTGTGTPMQPTPTTTDITNNARDTRPISHLGNGATK